MSNSAPREVMAYDVLIVGAGPAGLSCAIRLKQLARERQREMSVCVIDKGSEVGAHLMSGAVLEPRALDELLPDWKELDAPLTVAATADFPGSAFAAAGGGLGTGTGGCPKAPPSPRVSVNARAPLRVIHHRMRCPL